MSASGSNFPSKKSEAINICTQNQYINNQSTKPSIERAPNGVPKSHELLIHNTLQSLTNNDDRKATDDEKKQTKKRVHKAGEILLLKNKSGILQTVGPGNYPKKTYCYKMITDDGIQYFVKIFEDSELKPTKISKKLFTNAKLKCKMAPYLLLPAFKPQKTPLDGHTYEVVIYPFIKHCNLQDITLKALRQNYINPQYHKHVPPKDAHAAGYKLRMLRKMHRCVTIAIKMKDGGNGYVDMDISPDNFIITTSINDAANDDDRVRWDQITDAKNAKLIKIDHESMMQWKEKFDHVNKPMKASFKAPEINKTRDGEYRAFDVEKANVYQYGATFIYVLYGQMKHIDGEGNVQWKSLPERGEGQWQDTQWTPKYIDLTWLQRCIDGRPRVRPTYDDLLSYIKRELSKLESRDPSRRNNFGGSQSRGPNNFNSPHYHNNNGAVTIIFNPQHSSNTRMNGQQNMNNFNENPSQQRHRMQQEKEQSLMQYQQQQLRNAVMRNEQRNQQKPNNFQQRARRQSGNNFGGNTPQNNQRRQNNF